jgi:hypothetical protein
MATKSQRKTQQQFEKEAHKAHNHKYDYGKAIYQTAHDYLIIICSEHGEFKQTASSHLNGKGCKKCSKKYTPTADEFIEQAKIINGENKYDYSLIANNYKNLNTKVPIICKKHNKVFYQYPNKHLEGRNCHDCNPRKLGTEGFIKKSRSIHGDKYNYTPSIYKRRNIEIIINCPEHRDFKILPRMHWDGHGCLICDNKQAEIDLEIKIKNDTDIFIKKSKIKHGETYDYKLVIYINNRTKVKIICEEHGIFEQTPHEHLDGCGCPKCSHTVSHMEKAWLKSLNIPNLETQKNIKIGNRSFSLDGFDASTNTVYEFHGDFWHGNPEVYDLDKIHRLAKVKYRVLYEKTVNKEKIIKEAGYNLVVMWEKDWVEQEKKRLKK